MEANGSEQPKCQRSFNHRGRKNDCWDEVVKVLCMILRDDSISNIRLWKEKKVKIQEAFTQLEDMMSKNALQESCWTEVVKLLRIILGDESISTTTSWELKVMKVVKAIEQLKDPQFGFKMLKEMMKESISQNTKVKEAFQLIESVLNQSENSVPNQDHTNEINGLDQTVVYLIKKELQSLKEHLVQANAICDQKAQSMTEAKTFCKVSGMLSNVLKSCCAKMYDIVDSANSIQGPFVQIEDEQFALHFPGSKMIDEEKQAEEMKFAIKYVGGRLETLTLKMQSDQKMIPPAHLNPESSNPMGALGDSFDIEELQTDSPLESWLDNLISTVVIKGYEVYQRNADALNKIFQNHAHFADQFQLKDRVFQSNIMNALAEIYLKLESSLGKLELTEIDDILVRVKDMEVTGLELSWLRETLENQTKIKRLEEAIQESILELAKLKKKQRLE
ncbi:uncharacterized protein LOC105789263 isoform X2 [Gossypium raimondii]|uniref:Uncharacterized protein n=2 Tax=Gossypium raimondii TaxID=29730 RepID=A0A0D2QV08_GOSRA|nr:uncharacterized protein LOC105789263 isoform X2 [Gossypium raimondii]KJB20966.1 hypothetical protein B456_003G174800 [Gossypium raimondii]